MQILLWHGKRCAKNLFTTNVNSTHLLEQSKSCNSLHSSDFLWIPKINSCKIIWYANIDEYEPCSLSANHTWDKILDVSITFLIKSICIDFILLPFLILIIFLNWYGCLSICCVCYHLRGIYNTHIMCCVKRRRTMDIERR